MSVVSNTQLVVQAVGNWSPLDVCFVRELRLTSLQLRGRCELLLKVLLQPRPPQSAGWPDPAGRFWEVELRFDGVQELQGRQQGAGDLQVQGFDIEDLTRRWPEGIGLRVLGHEDRRLEFWARSAEILSCRETEERPTSQPSIRTYPGPFPS
jgi:hypothetical protein